MTHSTLTWFSSLITPVKVDEQFIITLYINGEEKVYHTLCQYAPEIDRFVDKSINRSYPRRSSVGYWAYVPKVLDLKREGKQSQIPEEK